MYQQDIIRKDAIDGRDIQKASCRPDWTCIASVREGQQVHPDGCSLCYKVSRAVTLLKIET